MREGMSGVGSRQIGASAGKTAWNGVERAAGMSISANKDGAFPLFGAFSMDIKFVNFPY